MQTKSGSIGMGAGKGGRKGRGGEGGRVSLIEPWYNTAQPLTLDGIIVFLNDCWKKEI